MKRFLSKPDSTWLLPALIATVLLAVTVFLPLWQMELVARQYPQRLIMHAYGYKFVGDDRSPYDDIREINGLNHYIGMRPLEEVAEMQLFLPGVAALIAGTLLAAFVVWKRRWLRGLIIAGFWTMPIFFVADLQFWLYRYGHTLDEKAPLDTGAFTPKVLGKTQVWNFHSETGFESGFYLMIAAALVITIGPPALRMIASRMGRPAEAETSQSPDLTAQPMQAVRVEQRVRP